MEREDMMKKENILLYADNIKKSFGITKALKGVQLELRKGEILGLIGENGSGKSTLTSIIAGIQTADAGELFMKGEAYLAKDSVDANQKGVCMILQEKATFDNLSVAQNIFVGAEKKFKEHFILNNRKMCQEAEEILRKIGVEHLKATDKIGTLNFEEGKLVELARAHYVDPEILIVDETTTALSKNGRDILYEMMQQMKEEGKGVIFISHDIDEMMEKCDRLTILRDGDYIDVLDKADFSPAKIRTLMVGRELTDNYYRTDFEQFLGNEKVLGATDVETKNLKSVSFTLHKGEILGFCGLADSGIHDVGKIAFGAQELIRGNVVDVKGEEINNPRKAMQEKIAYIGKNRDQESLFVNGPIEDNISITSLHKLAKATYISPKVERGFVTKWADELDVKRRDVKQFVSELSGGNKQKVAIAKWLGFDADIFVLDCPTRGIDIGVKTSIYRLMEKLKAEGKSIILISEELQEVIGMSDRIIVLKEGKQSGEFERNEQVTELKLINCMI